MKFTSTFILILAGVHLISAAQFSNQYTPVSMVFIVQENANGSCVSEQQMESIYQKIKDAIELLKQANSCGPGLWTRIAYLNMSDPSQHCPSNWNKSDTNGVRVCGRPSASRDMCHGTFYSSGGRTYTKVCGRVIGYQVGHPDAFHRSGSLNDAYVEGVSITYGSPRQHIWTMAADYSETGYSACPCDNGSTSSPPLFVGSNYYCESGNQNASYTNYFLYANDPLWDGQQCSSEGSCCSTAPWFSVNLINPTSNDIEVRICSDYDTSEDTLIELLELYIQ